MAGVATPAEVDVDTLAARLQQGWLVERDPDSGGHAVPEHGEVVRIDFLSMVHWFSRKER
jgi:hypothetical protein